MIVMEEVKREELGNAIVSSNERINAFIDREIERIMAVANLHLRDVDKVEIFFVDKNLVTPTQKHVGLQCLIQEGI